MHDLDYANKELSRKVSDKKFLNNCLRQAHKSLLWKAVACVYYVLVRVGGRISFNKVK